MHIELTPGAGNVVRFPIERRVAPSMDLLREIGPDPREVDMVVEAFGFEEDVFHTQEEADEAMADYIANHVRPEPGAQRRAALDDLLRPLVERAVDLCRRAHEAAAASVAAQRLLEKARSEGGYWLEALEERARERSNTAARLMVDAYVAKMEAEGAYRAIDLAKRGVAWKPRDLREEAWEVFFPGRPMPAEGW